MITIRITARKLFYAMIITGVLYCISQGIIMYLISPIGSTGLMKFQMTFDSERMAAIITSWGDAELEAFKKHLYFDFLHPLWYSAFLFFTILYIKTKLAVYQKSEAVPKYVYLPFAAAFIDVAENFLEIEIIKHLTNTDNTLVMAAGIVSVAKWLIILISLVIIAALVVHLAVQARRAQAG